MRSNGGEGLYVLGLTDFDVSLSDQTWGPHCTVSRVLATHKGGNQFLSQRYGMALCCHGMREKVKVFRERNKRQQHSLT